MGETVHAPCHIENIRVTKRKTNEKRVPYRFIPDVPRNQSWKDYVEDYDEKLVVPGVKKRKLRH